LLLIPLFPHFAMSSFETAVVRVQEVLAEFAPEIKLTVQPPYFDNPDYLAALVASAEPQLKGGYDHLLFSFHGIPERHLYKSDPTGCNCLRVSQCCELPSLAHATCYRAQCFRTVAGFVKLAGSGVYFGLPGNDRGNWDPWAGYIHGGGRDGVCANSLSERAPGVDPNAGKNERRFPVGQIGKTLFLGAVPVMMAEFQADGILQVA
jgi:hypothetical protein